MVVKFHFILNYYLSLQDWFSHCSDSTKSFPSVLSACIQPTVLPHLREYVTVTRAMGWCELSYKIPTFHSIACVWPWLSMFSLACVCFTVTYAVAGDVLMFVIHVIACMWPWLSMLYSYSLACVCYNWPNRHEMQCHVMCSCLYAGVHKVLW